MNRRSFMGKIGGLLSLLGLGGFYGSTKASPAKYVGKLMNDNLHPYLLSYDGGTCPDYLGSDGIRKRREMWGTFKFSRSFVWDKDGWPLLMFQPHRGYRRISSEYKLSQFDRVLEYRLIDEEV